MKAATHSLTKETVTLACYFGAASLVLQLSLPLIGAPQNLHIAGLVVLAAAVFLGAHGAWISAGLGLFPACFLQGDLGYAVRVLLVAGATGILAEHRRRIPSFILVSLLWVLVLGPVAALSLPTKGFSGSWTSLIMQGFADVSVALIAGTALLYPSIWVRFNNYPRQISLAEMLVYVAPLMASFAIWVVLGVLWLGGGLPDFPGWSGIALAVFAIWIPAWLGFRGTSVLERALDEFGAAGLLSSARTHTFSGKASDYWRRKTLVDVDRSELSARTTSRDSQNQLPPTPFAPDKGILAVSKQGTILFVNRLFRDLTELRTNEAIGRHLTQIQIDQQLLSQIEAVIARTFERGNCTRECRVNEMPDKLRFFEITGTRADSLEDSSIAEGPDSVIVTLKDITDRRTVETRLLQAQKLDSLGALVTGIAHAFNNALTTISGQASIATLKDGNKEKALSQILTTAKDAGTLVRQLLDFAEGGPALVKNQDLGMIISERLNLLREMVGEQNQISFTKKESPFPIHGDSNLIMQALTNLVINAKEALGPRSGSITISLEEEKFEADVSDLHVGATAGSYARLRVRDDGPGMPPEVLARAFDPLFTTRGTSGHAGLGLSIVFAIVRAHNGFLTAESFPERGTTISLYFPLQATVSEQKPSRDSAESPAAQGEEPREQRLDQAGGRREEILVVEDESGLRELLALMLKTLGYRVTTCSNGQEALLRCGEKKFDLLLVDMVMPRLPGLDLIAKLRGSGSVAKMLLMTGYGARVDAPGADNLLAKPFDIDGLEQAIRETMAGSKPESSTQSSS